MIRDFFLGFIKIHILHHAAKEPVYGLWLIEELREHGYDVSPGTLYPILHSLENQKLLRSYKKDVAGKIRKYYQATAQGKKMLHEAKVKMQELMDATKDYSDYNLNFCMAYGGRAEIVDAVNKIIRQGINEADEETITQNLYLQSEPDLIIRTSEQRLSNFLMWQCAYSEIKFLPDKLWPEFTRQDLIDCINEFNSSERRHGK